MKENKVINLGGRPTKYKLEYSKKAYELCKSGATKTALAIYFNVTKFTIYKWIKEVPDFKKSIEDGVSFFIKKGKTSENINVIINSEDYKKMKDYNYKYYDSKAYQNKKYSSKQGRLEMLLRARVYHALKNNTNVDHIKGLPYTKGELRDSIESKFKKGMRWDNYGDWHLDHIIPCSKFDHSCYEDVLKCWSLDNLQPLWMYQNLIKN